MRRIRGFMDKPQKLFHADDADYADFIALTDYTDFTGFHRLNGL
jgi:hypothetical protein